MRIHMNLHRTDLLLSHHFYTKFKQDKVKVFSFTKVKKYIKNSLQQNRDTKTPTMN